MDLSGPRAINSINALSKPELGLRLFQRVTAQVLDVTGTTAVLSVEGIPIVAQLTSTDQAATLLTQHAAQFVVIQLTNQKVTLRMIGNDVQEISSGPPSSSGTELAIRVLEENNLPVTDQTLVLARAILKQHLPVTKDLLNELIHALDNYGNWEMTQADIAAALKAADLPVSAQSIDLASRRPRKVGDSVSQILKLIKDMAGQNLPAQILEQLNDNLQLLSGSVLDGTEEVDALVKQLRSMLETMGRSQENVLLAQSQNADSNPAETSLLDLARLGQMLKQAGRNEGAETIRNFLEDIRSQQFLNSKSDWLAINFPLQNTKTDQEFSSARIRVARESQTRSGKINPSSTRFILQVDIDSNETVEVDLSIGGQQVRTSVTTTSPVLCQQAADELPSLDQALQNLGFMLQDAKVSVGEPQQFKSLNVMPNSVPVMAVDIEI